MTPQQKIVEILESWEDRLSDGYGYYVTPEDVQETLREIADEIIAVINKPSTPIKCKCDDCEEPSEYHYCYECMDNHRG